MFEKCRPRNLAAITYDPFLSTNLSRYSPDRRPPSWNELAPSQKGSISKFAWQIQSGDKIYVRDSARPNLLVGMGYVQGKEGRKAYFYDKDSPIQTSQGVVWRHLLNVDWDDSFTEVSYKDHSANTTVLGLDENELFEHELGSRKREYKEHGLASPHVDLAVDLEIAYPRATPATIRLILPKHVTLSRRFQVWLHSNHGIHAQREVRQIDLKFALGDYKAMAEFKIAYNGNTRAAIREALGQILEYNHYPPRETAKTWFLILDKEPDADDLAFVKTLRKELAFPIYLGWEKKTHFSFYPNFPL